MNVLMMYEPSPSHLQNLQNIAPNASFYIATSETIAIQQIEKAEVVLGNRYFLQSLPYARQLQWMQSNSVGVELILEKGGTALDNIILTCCRGVYDNEIADHALALILSLFRKIHWACDNQSKRHWKRFSLPSLTGKRALILGWGGVGKSIAYRLQAFGVQVEGVRRRHLGEPSPDKLGFLIRGPTQWQAVLPQTDILVLALPKTTETTHLVAFQELTALPPNSYVVNVGRGGTLNENDLHKVLQTGKLGGVALDVFEEEPLPEHHWMWTADRLLLTPHWARSFETSSFSWQPLFEENLHRFVNGQELLNVVDKEIGY